MAPLLPSRLRSSTRWNSTPAHQSGLDQPHAASASHLLLLSLQCRLAYALSPVAPRQRHHDLGGPVMVRRFELQHDITSTRALKPFVVNGGASDVATAKGLSIWVVIYQRHSRYLIWRVKHIASVAWGLWLSWKSDRAGFVAK